MAVPPPEVAETDREHIVSAPSGGGAILRKLHEIVICWFRRVGWTVHVDGCRFRFAGRVEIDPESNGAATADRSAGPVRHPDVCYYRPRVSQRCLSPGVQAKRHR